METMLVTQALNELKTIDGRIKKAISQGVFVTGAKASEKNAAPGVTKEDFIANAKASKQSIDDLIARREKIKAAVVASNAVTLVPELGMTVAAAIETKASISYKKALLAELNSQYRGAVATVNSQNAKVDQAIENLVNTAYGSGGSGTSKDKQKSYSEDDYNAIAVPYKKAHEWELLDPIKIKEQIDALDNEIREFESKVDSALQISNCTTIVTIE